MARRVALVPEAVSYVGPALARVLAARGHDLVLGTAPAGLPEQLESLGAAVEVAGALDDEGLVAAARERFGRLDAAVTFSGRIVTGRFLRSTVDDLHDVLTGCIEAPYRFLRAVMPLMVEQRDGQVLVIASAAGARPTPGAPLYSAARAGAVMLARNVAAEVAADNVQVNAVGTNFMDFPAFLKANKAEEPEGRARVEAQVPMKRLGTMEEFAHFCAVFLDGTSRFTTGQFVPYAGGWA